jgi:adenylate kinase family enzyme/phosphoglycolate phosphatase-like HAD superfamily hydrolase
MALLFRHSYELRAKEAAKGGAPVVVVGPPCAGKTTFIKQFLEPHGVEAAEETAGLAPKAEETREEGLLQRLRKRVLGRYVRGDEVKRELDGISGAGFLEAFDKLPRDFVEHLKKKYDGWSLYLFRIPPDAEYEEAKSLRAVMEEVGVEFRWFGLSYLPPGLAKALAEKGEDYVRRQLKLYKELAEELDIAEGRLRKAAESALESLLGQVKEVAERLIDVAAPGAGVAASILTEVLTALLFSRGGRNEFIKLVARLGELDEALRCILAARLALALGLDRGAVEKALATLAGADLQKLAEEVKALKNAADRLWVEVKSAKRGVDVLFLEDVEMGGLYENFVVLNERPYVDLQEGLFPLVAGGRFEEEARRVLEKLERDGVAVLVGPKGVGKSTLAAYVVWKMLSGGGVEAAIRVEKSAKELTLKRIMEFVKRKTVVLYDPSPLEVYYKHKYMEETERPEEVIETLEELADFFKGGGVRLLVVLPTDLYEVVEDKVFESFKDAELKKAFKNAVLKIELNDVEFLHLVIKTYSSCGGDYSKLAEEIAQFNGGYTLVAKYAGLWLRERGCDVSDVERAVEEAKKEPKLFLARYIRDVLLWRNSVEERVRLMYRVAAPLLLHAVFGPVPEGVTYITQAKSDATFYQPEEIEKLTKPQWNLLKVDLQPIAKWLAQRHEDLVEEALRDLAGINGEEARKPYKEALGDLIEALDGTRGEALKEGDEILAELGVPKEHRVMWMSLLVFVNRRLAAVFKSGGCWQRVAFIAGHALARYPKLPTTKPPGDTAEVLGDALKSCAVDDYLTIGGEIPPLSVLIVELPYYVEALYAGGLSQIRRIRERLGVLSPLVDADIIEIVKKTVEGLLARWRREDVASTEILYALGLTALAAGAEVDEKTADLLLRTATTAVQEVAHPAAVLPVLAALRPLGEKAPHRYVVALAAASELRQWRPETAQYIYNALQQLKDRLRQMSHVWPLVEAVDAYSNLLRKHLKHIADRWEEAVEGMCSLYGEVKKRVAEAPDGDSLAQHLLETAARASVVAVALENGDLAPHVQVRCGLSDFVKEAEAVRETLNDIMAHPEKLKTVENNEDLAEWVRTRSIKGDARKAFEDLRTWFTGEIALYKLRHALNERGDLDQEKLKQAAKDFEDAAEIASSTSGHPVSQGEEKLFKDLEQWINYLNFSYWALRAYILAAKSCEEFLRSAEGLQTPETTKSFPELWNKAWKNIIPPAEYLETTANIFGGYLVCLAASGKKKEVEELLKEWRWLLYYSPEVSIATRLILKLFDVGEGAKLYEIVYVFEPRLLPEFRPALLMLASRLQRDKALEKCEQLPNAQQSKARVCVNAVYAAAGGQMATHRLKSSIEEVLPNIGKVMQEAHRLLNEVDGRSLVEVLAPGDSQTQTAFMLLAAVEGRAKAVRLHGLLGSAKFNEPLSRRLFRAVYKNCGKLNSEECKMALLKLYYLQF